MPTESAPDLSLFFDILQTLERLQALYMIIGAFAATLYGNTSVTGEVTPSNCQVKANVFKPCTDSLRPAQIIGLNVKNLLLYPSLRLFS